MLQSIHTIIYIDIYIPDSGIALFLNSFLFILGDLCVLLVTTTLLALEISILLHLR